MNDPNKSTTQLRGLIVFIFLVVSGFYLTLSFSWNGVYRTAILLHPIAGILNVIFFPLSIISLLRNELGVKSLPKIILPAIPFVALMCFLKDYRFFYFFTFAYGAFFYIASFRILKRLDAKSKKTFRFLSIMFFVWLQVAVSGIMMVACLSKSGITPIYIQHRWWSAVFVLFLVVFYTGPTFVGLKSDVPKKSVWLIRASGIILLSVYIAGFFFTARNSRAYDIHLSTVVLEKRTAVERDMNPKIPVKKEAYNITESCGAGSGCHREIVKQHLMSPHNRTLWPSYFRKNLNEMTSEVGIHNTVTCAGCHYPYGVINRKKDYTYFAAGNNCYSCTVCHMISEVQLDRKKGKTRYSLAWHGNHLGMFLDERGSKLPEVSTLDRVLIMLNRTGHAKVFSRRLYKKDEYCMVCHMRFKQLNPHPSGLKKPTCINCHMQPGQMIGLGKTKKNHFFPGASAHLPLLLGDRENYQRVVDYATGKLSVNLPKGWRSLWSVRYGSEDPLPERVPWLIMFFDFLNIPVPGKKMEFEVHTYNAALGHPFPVASVDMLEAWLEVEVIDAKGNIIFRSGGLDSRHKVLPSSHTLGGYMIGDDGKIITQNRVWQIKKKIITRDIPPGEKVMDDYFFQIPAKAAGKLTFRASWRYRKFNQDLMNWAYGRNTTAPVLTIASIEKVLDIP